MRESSLSQCDNCDMNTGTKCRAGIQGFPIKYACGVFNKKTPPAVLVSQPPKVEPRQTEGRIVTVGDIPKAVYYFKLP